MAISGSVYIYGGNSTYILKTRDEMKKSIIKGAGALLMLTMMSGCGDSFLDTNIYNGIDLETGLDNVTNIGYALNGTYYNFYQYQFAGNYATMLGDIASDLAYWNTTTNHWVDINQFTPTPTTVQLKNIWEYGYKVIDNSARIIKAGKELYETLSEEEQQTLDVYMGEAYALRAYSTFVMVNIFGHQIKVNGEDFSSEPGVVIVDNPIAPGQKVSRATVGETYKAIEGDIKSSLQHFKNAGKDGGSLFCFTPKGVWGLYSRVLLYEERFKEAVDAAEKALDLAGITELACTAEGYKALYAGGTSNTESLFALDINARSNWSSNSCGTTWSSYGYSPSPYLQSIMTEDDVRRTVWAWNKDSTPETPIFESGKFSAYGIGGVPAYGTNYLINAPEMFLNKAEGYVNFNDLTNAREALLTVARRNPHIENVEDLPSDADGLRNFIKDERGRELFQEGLRLYDLRRWDIKANLHATEAPSISWLINDFKVSGIVYPIPVAEINTGYGVEQTPDWKSTFPSI